MSPASPDRPPVLPTVPRLVATDLDGTLLGADGTVSERTRRVLAALDERGVPVVFVTGRPLRWMNELWSEVGSLGLAIVSNGAVTYNVAHSEILEVTGIDAGLGAELVAAIAAELPEVRFAIECLDGIRVGPGFAPSDGRLGNAREGTLSEIWDEPAVKLLLRGDGIDDERLRQAVVAGVGTRATPTWSMPGLVEVSAAGVTKAAALADLCGPRGIEASGVIAFGDMPNDLDMLTWAGTAVAMPHAAEQVLAVADRIAPGHDEDGVAQVLVDVFGLDEER